MSAPVTVRLPGPLRERAGGASVVRAQGGTLREVIADLDRQFPGMQFRLCDETGELRPFVNIFIETESVRDRQWLQTSVPGGATLHILLSVAGG